jgi:hypothetical protein
LNFLLHEYKEDKIYKFLEEPWKGKDKQESLFRLFAFFGFFKNFKGYHVCDGNYNNGTIEIAKILNLGSMNLKDKGDKSDLTLMSSSRKRIIACTSKNLNKYSVGKLDIRDILFIRERQYKDKELKICIIVRSKIKLMHTAMCAETCNDDLKFIILGSIIIDWFDLDCCFQYLKYLQSENLLDTLGIENDTCVIKTKHKERKSIWCFR